MKNKFDNLTLRTEASQTLDQLDVASVAGIETLQR